jgi:FMN phosphatase YigB (HAD superfamily)
VAFIDDRLPNVEGAFAFGWQAHLWQSDADSLAWLNSLGNPLIG